MLQVADYLMHALHLSVIAFNLFGWISPRMRRMHRYLVALTATCWLAVGLYVGKIGYCPLTDWHWQIKRALGQNVLPNSYIDYVLQAAGIHAAPQNIDMVVGVTFAIIVLITLVLWLRERALIRQRG